MKLPVVLAVLIGIALLACSTAETVPSTVAPVAYSTSGLKVGKLALCPKLYRVTVRRVAV